MDDQGGAPAGETPEEVAQKLAAFEEQLAQVDAALEAAESEEDKVALRQLREQLQELVAMTRELIQEPPDAPPDAPPEPAIASAESAVDADGETEEVEMDVFDLGTRVRARWRDGTYEVATVEDFEYDDETDRIMYRLTFARTGLLLQLPAADVAGPAEPDEGGGEGGGGGGSGGVEVSHYDWDRRGVASKMMSKMGFVPGKGLGREKHGIAEALPVGAVLPRGTPLDRASEAADESRQRNWRRTAGAAAGDSAVRAGEVLIGEEVFEGGKRKVVVVRRKRAKKGGGVDEADPTNERARERRRDVFEFLNASLVRGGAGGDKRPPPAPEKAGAPTPEEARGQLLRAREAAEEIKKKVAALDGSIARAKKHRDGHAERAFSERRTRALAKLAECLREAQRLEERCEAGRVSKNKKAGALSPVFSDGAAALTSRRSSSDGSGAPSPPFS